MKELAGRRKWITIIAFAGSLVLAINAASFHVRVPRGTAVAVDIEPERNGRFDPATRPLSASDASGGGFIAIQGWEISDPDYGHRVAGETAYAFETSVAGTYHSWVRARWGGTCNNSITMAVVPRGSVGARAPEQVLRHLVGNDQVFEEWHWVRGPVLELESGAYDALIGTRESNVLVDRIILTLDGDSDPRVLADAPPADSRREQTEPFSDAFTTGLYQWLLAESEWRQVRRNGLSAVGPMRARLCLAQARTLPVAAARMECSLMPAERTAVGLFFGRIAPDDYFLARLVGRRSSGDSVGTIQICHRHGDSLRVLSESHALVADGRSWELLTVWFGGPYCRVLVAQRPVLEARLPRDARGNVGLYSDRRNPLLLSTEAAERVEPRRERRVRLAEFLPLHDSGAQAWPGLITPLSDDQALVVRWTHFDRDSTFAKRVELVRNRSDGAVELLGERWGVFAPEVRPSLTLDWSEGLVRASVTGRTFATSPGRPENDLGGLVGAGKTRELFGDFVLEPLPFALPDPSTGPGSAAPAPRARRLQLDRIGAGVLSTFLDAGALPFAWIFDLDGNGVADTLGVAAAGAGPPRMWLTRNGRRQSRTMASGRDPGLLQAYFAFGEFLVFADGRLMFSEPRSEAMTPDVVAAGGAPGSRTAYMGLPAVPSFFGLGHGSDPAGINGRWLNGDAMIQLVDLNWGDAGRLELQLHASRSSAESGYEVKIVGGQTTIWEARRNGVVIGRGAMPPGHRSTLRFFQIGSALTLLAGSDPVFHYVDPDPLRSGFVGVTVQGSSPRTEVPLVLLKQAWDTHCMFHQEVGAVASMALWAPRTGEWTLEEDPGRVEGYLVARGLGKAPAILEYRGPLQAHELLVELCLSRARLTPGHKLSFVLADGASRPRDVVSLEWQNRSRLACTLRRGAKRIPAYASVDTSNAAPVLTVLRAHDELCLYLDHRLVARVHAPAEGDVEKVRLEVEGPAHAGLAIPSISIQQNPFAAPRVPELRRQQMAFLTSILRAP
jgi:hypothetical protein